MDWVGALCVGPQGGVWEGGGVGCYKLGGQVGVPGGGGQGKLVVARAGNSYLKHSRVLCWYIL